ncbi:Uncharacterised protein [Bordetella pertussis]|nr:Uncharacterised protein [Bordetella pertussis]CFP58688.1 Uncharacterised protein [Bordetella pertussis]CFW48380.1 Uncharacterised protein [Bordetella pertussis]
MLAALWYSLRSSLTRCSPSGPSVAKLLLKILMPCPSRSFQAWNAASSETWPARVPMLAE